MALEHAKAGEAWSVAPLGSDLSTTPSSALFKTGRLEVMRLVLQAGKVLPSHQVAGDITIQCLEGSLVVVAQDVERRLDAGHLMYLPGGASHAVRALADSSALVTIVLVANREAGES